MGQLQGLGSLAGWSASVIWRVRPDSLSLPRHDGRYHALGSLTGYFVLGSVAGCLPRHDGRYHALGSLTG